MHLIPITTLCINQEINKLINSKHFLLFRQSDESRSNARARCLTGNRFIKTRCSRYESTATTTTRNRASVVTHTFPFFRFTGLRRHFRHRAVAMPSSNNLSNASTTQPSLSTPQATPQRRVKPTLSVDVTKARRDWNHLGYQSNSNPSNRQIERRSFSSEEQ